MVSYATGLGPTQTLGGYSNVGFGTPGLPFGYGFPSPGADPLFIMGTPAALSGNINRLLGYANGSSVNVNFGPIPSTLGFGGLLLGTPFYATYAAGAPDAGGDQGIPSFLNGYLSSAVPTGSNSNFGGPGFASPGQFQQPQMGIPQQFAQQPQFGGFPQQQFGGFPQQQFGGIPPQQMVGFPQQPQFGGFPQQPQFGGMPPQFAQGPQFDPPQFGGGFPQQQFGGFPQQPQFGGMPPQFAQGPQFGPPQFGGGFPQQPQFGGMPPQFAQGPQFGAGFGQQGPGFFG